MTWIALMVVIVVLGVAVALVVAYTDAAVMPEVASDRAEVSLPADRPLQAADLASVRFTQTLRGYAPDEVDDLLERLRNELAARETDGAGGPDRG